MTKEGISLFSLGLWTTLVMVACGGNDGTTSVGGFEGCAEGELNSDGVEYYACSGGGWAWVGCVEGVQKNDGTYIYSCVSNQWFVAGTLGGEPGFDVTGCIDGSVIDGLICQGGQWVSQTVPDVPNIPPSDDGISSGSETSGSDAGTGTGSGGGTTSIANTVCGPSSAYIYNTSYFRDENGIKYRCEPICSGGFCEPDAIWKPFQTIWGHDCKTTDYFVPADPDEGIPDYCLNIVTINGKTWMAENMPVFANLEMSYGATWYYTMGFSEAEKSTKVPDGQIVQGICPPGWHIPTVTEWNTLLSNRANASAADIYDTGDFWSSVQTGGYPIRCGYEWDDGEGNYCSDFLVDTYDEKSIRCVK